MYNFEIYCGKNVGGHEGLPLAQGEANVAYIVVIGLLAGLKEQAHWLVMDNFFGSIQLFLL